MTDDPATAMQALYDDHAAALWGFCLHLTGNDRARAEDVAQETMLRAWRNAAVLTESRGSVRSWLFTVARHIVIDEWRSRRGTREFATADPPQGEVGDDGTDELLLSWVVADALRRLSDDHRAVLVECYYRGRSVAEAARRLDIPEGTVKSRTHYALRALRLILEETGVAS
ncbi:sigma-70 family RNA polymerase sigma factor [Nocardioides sp. L-11A]|uniref:sigma-70 family RNA polymerase sigma factor n=1 Tax=Nocardioides sp. L-11A TaxID=3043848 RepID=UPI00249C0720|nr:sigma-70 family RNA polymerase sigma factor [Nocardioides sp. L-11A]